MDKGNPYKSLTTHQTSHQSKGYLSPINQSQPKRPYGYSNADQVFYVVHDLEYGALDIFIPYAGVRGRFCLQDAPQMVLHITGNVQRSALLLHRYVQDHRYCHQRSAVCSAGDNRIN